MSFLSYIKKIDEKEFKDHPYKFINSISFNSDKLEECDIAIISIEEDRNSDNHGCANGFNVIKKELFNLSKVNTTKPIVDLGIIKKGKKVKDTYFAVVSILEELIKLNIFPIIIGGSQELTYHNYISYKNLEQSVNLLTVSNQLNIGDTLSTLNTNNFISKIIQYEPTHLFNYSNLGYQTYFSNSQELELMEKLNFEIHSLGEIQKNIENIEPIIRDGDIFSFSINSLRQSDSPGYSNPSPNGFFGNEACKLSYFAGISDKLSSAGFYDYNPELDIRNLSAKQMAQIIWYFIYGFTQRKKDYPIGSKVSYAKYLVEIEDNNYQISFYKSPTQRWWMEVQIPSSTQNKYKRNLLIPCTKADYDTAMSNQLPDRWWKAYQKLV